MSNFSLGFVLILQSPMSCHRFPSSSILICHRFYNTLRSQNFPLAEFALHKFMLYHTNFSIEKKGKKHYKMNLYRQQLETCLSQFLYSGLGSSCCYQNITEKWLRSDAYISVRCYEISDIHTSITSIAYCYNWSYSI